MRQQNTPECVPFRLEVSAEHKHLQGGVQSSDIRDGLRYPEQVRNVKSQPWTHGCNRPRSSKKAVRRRGIMPVNIAASPPIIGGLKKPPMWCES